jgi:hypothetical protein
MTRKLTGMLVSLLLTLLLTAATAIAERPLSKDDVTLLLLGGASSDKVLALIQQRGIDFQMNADLAKKFHDSGASDEVIEALQKAGTKVQAAPSSAPAAAKPTNQPGPQTASNANADQKVNEVLQGLKTNTPTVGDSGQSGSPNAAGPPSVKASKPGGPVDLSDPSPDRIQQIIHEFAAKEKIFKEARNNYTYHQMNKVETIDSDGNVDGMYQQEWDILYDDAGSRIERVTYAPVDTLKRIMVTQEDLNSMRNIQPFVMTSDELPEYEVKYLGHVKVDEITAYVFSIRPKEIKKGRQYFQGVVWVDDRDLQIVKTEGKPVPELRTKKGENLFPRFTTWREQIDGKFWFPTYTMADDTLYFSGGGPVHIKEIIRYADYKQFKSKVRILTATPTDQPNAQPTPVPNQ